MSIRTALLRVLQVKDNPAVRYVILPTTYGDVQWTEKNFKDLSEAGYKNCMTAFACTNLIAKTAAGLEFQVENAEGEEQENHEFLKLWNRPNKQESKRTMMTKLISYLLLNGNAYLLNVPVAGKPRFLYSLRPDRVQILKGSGFDLVGGYRYEISGTRYEFKPNEVLHLKLFHPTDDWYGYGMIAAASRGVDVSNLADEWNAKLLTNDMKPPGMFTTDGVLSDKQIDHLNAQIKEDYSGASNAGKPLLGQGGLKFVPFSFSQKEMDWLQGERNTSRKICSVFGVAPELVGDSEAKTYSNYQEARKALFTETVLPMMSFITDELDNWLMPLYGEGLTLKVDTEQIEALQEDRNAKFTYLQACDFLTINEKRIACGYDDIGTDGEVILVPFGKVPLEQAIAKPEPVPDALQPGNAPPSDEKPPVDETSSEAADQAKSRKSVSNKASFWSAPERKEKLWKSFEMRVMTRERSFEILAKTYLAKQADEIRKKASVAGSINSLSADDLLSVEVEATRYVKTFRAWYVDHFRRGGEAGMRASKGDLFDDAEHKASSWMFNMTEAQAKTLRRMIFESGTEVNKTALEKIQKALVKAQLNNDTITEFASELYDKLDDFTISRARMWARTESAKVDNFGQLEGYKVTEFVTRKGWLCAFVPDSRSDHEEADGQEVALDDDFSIGGELMAYPGDPKGAAGQVVNCLCSIFPVIGD